MTATSDFSRLDVRSVVWACIAIILLIALYPLLTTGYVVPDDFQYALWAKSPDRWERALEAAQGQGRFQLFFHISLAYVPYLLDSPIFLKTLQIGSIVAAALAFALAVSRYLNSTYHGLVSLLLFGALLQNMWEHHILAAYPFIFQFGLFFLALSFLAYRNTLKGNDSSGACQAAIYLFIALLVNEAFVMYAVIYFILALLYGYKEGARAVAARILPIFAAVGLFIGIYLTWRAYFPTTYEGARIDLAGLEWGNVWDVVWQFSKASLPVYVHSHFSQIHYEFPASPEGFRRSIEHFLLNLQVAWLTKAILVGAGIALTQRFITNNTSNARFFALLLVGIALFLLPSLPLALTPKYQAWVHRGTPAYTVTYFSYFGVLLILVAIVGRAGTLGNPHGALRRLAIGIMAGLAMLLSLVTDYGNAAMYRSQSLEAWKWKLFDHMILSADFNQVPERACILLDGLTTPLVFGYMHPDFWAEDIAQKTGKWPMAYDQQDAFFNCMQEYKVPGFMIRYRQEGNTPNQFITLANVQRREGTNLVGNHAIVISAGYSRKFFVTWASAEDRHDSSAIINGVAINSTGRFSAFPVDASKQRWGMVRTEISKPDMILNSISENFFRD